MKQNQFQNLSGGVESRHARDSATADFPGAPSNRAVDKAGAINPTDYPSDSGISAPPAQFNFPVPVLAEPQHVKLLSEACETAKGGEARESANQSNQNSSLKKDSCGGENHLPESFSDWLSQNSYSIMSDNDCEQFMEQQKEISLPVFEEVSDEQL